MGLFDHLFKSKSPPAEEQTVETGSEDPSKSSETAGRNTPSPKADPSAFLHPKSFVPRGISPLNPPLKSGALSGVRKPGGPPPPVTPEDIVLTLGDVLSRIPTPYLKQGVHDPKRELRFSINDLSSDIARGRAAVPLSRIAELLPDIFVKQISRDEDSEIRLPLQKLVEQIGLLRSRPNLAERLRRPFVPPVLEALVSPTAAPDLKFEVSPAAPLTFQPLPESIQGASQSAEPMVELKPTTATVSPVEAVAERIQESKPTNNAPAEQPASDARPEPEVLPDVIANHGTKLPEPVAASTTSIEPIPIELAPATVEQPPITEPAPEPPLKSVVAPEETAPIAAQAGPPKNSPLDETSAVPLDQPIIESTVQLQKLEEKAVPTTLETSPIDLPETDPTGEKIYLNLGVLLKQCPREIVVGEMPAVPANMRIALPFAPIDRQLISGRAEISAVRFVAALPFTYQKHFSARMGVKVPIPLEEVYKNLPSPAHEAFAAPDRTARVLAPVETSVLLQPSAETTRSLAPVTEAAQLSEPIVTNPEQFKAQTSIVEVSTAKKETAPEGVAPSLAAPISSPVETSAPVAESISAPAPSQGLPKVFQFTATPTVRPAVAKPNGTALAAETSALPPIALPERTKVQAEVTAPAKIETVKPTGSDIETIAPAPETIPADLVGAEAEPAASVSEPTPIAGEKPAESSGQEADLIETPLPAVEKPALLGALLPAETSEKAVERETFADIGVGPGNFVESTTPSPSSVSADIEMPEPPRETAELPDSQNSPAAQDLAAIAINFEPPSASAEVVSTAPEPPVTVEEPTKPPAEPEPSSADLSSTATQMFVPPLMFRPLITLPPPIFGYTPAPREEGAKPTDESVDLENRSGEEMEKGAAAERADLDPSEISGSERSAGETADAPTALPPEPQDVEPAAFTPPEDPAAAPRIISIDFSQALEEPTESSPAAPPIEPLAAPSIAEVVIATAPAPSEEKASAMAENEAASLPLTEQTEVPVEIPIVENAPEIAAKVDAPLEAAPPLFPPAAPVPSPSEVPPPTINLVADFVPDGREMVRPPEDRPMPFAPKRDRVEPLEAIVVEPQSPAETAEEAPEAETVQAAPTTAPAPAMDAEVPQVVAESAPLVDEPSVVGEPSAEEEANAAAAPLAPIEAERPVVPPEIPAAPFLTLPKVIQELSHPEILPPPPLALRRFDQDALQAIFMTEDLLDLPKISRLAAQLPGVHACVIATRDQACTGGQLPEGFDLAALLGLAPRVGEAAGRLPIGELKHFTLYGERYSVSFFERNGLSLCAVHRPRSFVPGVREKLVAIADELSRS